MATSPFIEGTSIQWAWDSTSLGWFKECPRKYYYSMVLGYRSKGESVHLRFGIEYHHALELYDKLRAQGAEHEQALREALREVLQRTWPWDFDHPTKTRENLVRTVLWYLEQFADDPAKTVILANGQPAVELSFRFDIPYISSVDTNRPYMLCGHLDRVVEFQSLTFVMDRKTASSTLASNYFDQYEPDNQMTLYTYASKVVYNTPVRGVIIDAAQVAVGFSRFSRGFSYRTPAQLDEWMDGLTDWFALAENYALSERWPMNDKSCHKFGGCVFRKVCSKDPGVRQITLDSDFEVNRWNPLETR